jgi:hypothetical protein
MSICDDPLFRFCMKTTVSFALFFFLSPVVMTVTASSVVTVTNAVSPNTVFLISRHLSHANIEHSTVQHSTANTQPASARKLRTHDRKFTCTRVHHAVFPPSLRFIPLLACLSSAYPVFFRETDNTQTHTYQFPPHPRPHPQTSSPPDAGPRIT